MIGYRKYSIMIILVVIGISFRLANLINGSEMVDLLKVSGAAFFASNMMAKFTEIIKDKAGQIKDKIKGE